MRTTFVSRIACLLLGLSPILGCAAAIPVPSELRSPEADALPTGSVKMVPVVTGLEHPWGWPGCRMVGC